VVAGTRPKFFRSVVPKHSDSDGKVSRGSYEPHLLFGWFKNLSFEEALILTTGVRPSKLRKVYWTHSHNDLVKIVDVRTQYEIAKAYQIHESFRLVAAEVFGGGKSSSSTPSPEGKPVETMQELMAAFASVGGSLG